MADVTTRPFSKNYSGLINQTVIGASLIILCVTAHELMKRRRRGKAKTTRGEGLGSVESWEFGYLYQGRSWAKNPSPPTPSGWPLSWVKPVIDFPEEQMRRLRGIDATLYIRFLRGTFWWVALHTLTTFPILFPIHVTFAGKAIESQSMTRASISSLAMGARGLLWIHICLLIWLTLTWLANLIWICHGAFRLRQEQIADTRKRMSEETSQEKRQRDRKQHHPHPHPQYQFHDIHVPERGDQSMNQGIRFRTIMVSNVPAQLRTEKDLKEYFEYYMSRPLDKPSVGLTSSTQPGMLNKSFVYLFNRVKRIPAHLPTLGDAPCSPGDGNGESNSDNVPVIDRVVIARKMTELASLLGRREDVLRRLETAHLKLAKKVMTAVAQGMDQTAKPESRLPFGLGGAPRVSGDLEQAKHAQETSDQESLDSLITSLGHFVDDFGLRDESPVGSNAFGMKSNHAFRKIRMASNGSEDGQTQEYPPSAPNGAPVTKMTIWEALLKLPRHSLDPYQPLANLSHFYRGRVVPSIDYYTAKLGLLTSLITENRSKADHEFEAVSTAFVTFSDPVDARRACKYLAVHPDNPLACMVEMAPSYEDIDFARLMKSHYRVEFVKDWVVSLGVWAFTVLWLFPVAFLIALVSVQSISVVLPALKAYLDKHAFQAELIQSFVPTLLVALLAILVPLILLLIAKKAHTITTLSALHDRIMTRYYKFLIVNVLVFFCVGTLAVQSFFIYLRPVDKDIPRPNVIEVVANSFPAAGPFYVGWLIFNTAMHSSFELALFGLPLLVYPTTSHQVTPRKRATGIRPRTLNYYYWLPTHLLIIHVLLVFSVMNPLVIPFGLLYFFVQCGIIKNQLLHVYAKNYEGNGQLILVRLVRYSLDGSMLSQAVFLAYMVVLKKTANVAVAAVLIIFTAVIKIMMTRMIRAQHEKDDIVEAHLLCGTGPQEEENDGSMEGDMSSDLFIPPQGPRRKTLKTMITWNVPAWVNFSYGTVRHQPGQVRAHKPNPFGPEGARFSRLNSMSVDLNHMSDNSAGQEGGMSQLLNLGFGALGPVTPHPPVVSWDDESNPDQPYDNPYYTKAIANSLWLPRDPFGVLDLDDTVDMHVSLTSDGTGLLGTWLGPEEVSSPLALSSVGSTEESQSPEQLPSLPSSPDSMVSSGGSRYYTGREEIALSAGIAKRVQALEDEDEIEQTLERRPSMFRKRGMGDTQPNSSSTIGGGLSPRRPSVHDGNITYRSFSSGSTRRTRATSLMSTLHLSPQRALSIPLDEEDPSTRPDMHAQADLVARSRASVTTGGGSQYLDIPADSLGVRRSNTERHGSRHGNITTQEAVVQEVIAEEEKALQERICQEEAERSSRGLRDGKTWLTSWAFAKPKPGPPE